MPFLVKVGTHKLLVNVERDGRGGWRYYYVNRTRRDKSGKRFCKVRCYLKDEIQRLARGYLENLESDKVVLTREQFTAHEDLYKRVTRIERELLGTNLSLEVLVGQAVPTLQLVLPHKVTLAQVLEAGRAYFVPAEPAKIGKLMDDLLPMLKINSTSEYVNKIDRLWECLRLRHGNDFIHTVKAPQLEQLLRDYRAGMFLSDAKKLKILRRKKSGDLAKDLKETVIWYGDKSVKHVYDSIRRLYIRAFALGAWPAGQPLATETMEAPQADQPDLDAITPEDWALLLSVLDAAELRYVSLVISDIRSSEIERLNERHLHDDQNGLPITVDLAPKKTKGKKGGKKGRPVTLLPNASVILHLNRPPKGCSMLPASAQVMQERVNEKARKLGIATTHNYIRRAHDTYWYGLRNVRHEYNRDSSHTKEMVENVYRGSASFEECVRFYTALPPNTPPHLAQWVRVWVDQRRKDVRGEPVCMPPTFIKPNDSHVGHEKAMELVTPPNDHLAAERGVAPVIIEHVQVAKDKPNEAQPSQPVGQYHEQTSQTIAPITSHSNDPRHKPPAYKVNINEPIPQPPKTEKGKIDWDKLKVNKEWLDKILEKYPGLQIGKAWGISDNALRKGAKKLGLCPRNNAHWAKVAAAQRQSSENIDPEQNDGCSN